MTRVLAFTKYGREAASTRQRLMQFLPSLGAAGFGVEVRPLLDDDYVRALAKGDGYSKLRIVQSYARRLRDLRDLEAFDLVWAYAELFPKLPAMFERLVYVSGKPLIYDMDDAFFHAHERSALVRDKLRPLIEKAAAVTAGNDYLAAYAGRWNENVRIVPTVVDTSVYRPISRRDGNVPLIGWIGSPSTWNYVRPMLPLLREICDGGKARFLAVGAGKVGDMDRFDGMEIRDWAEHREVSDVQEMDIGIMPLPDEPWARGKCGYKLIQYMACGLPVVASPVGVNCDIVGKNETGFLCSTPEEWRCALNDLIADPSLRADLGAVGRQRVVERYSLAAHAPRIVEIFRSAVSQ